jgi:hypothetical protein
VKRSCTAKSAIEYRDSRAAAGIVFPHVINRIIRYIPVKAISVAETSAAALSRGEPVGRKSGGINGHGKSLGFLPSFGI